jgi:hypothetical protein
MARLWRDHGKPQQARELLAPVYDWQGSGKILIGAATEGVIDSAPMGA